MKLIITADLHLRNDRPQCRLDEDWDITQMGALRQIVKYANEHEAYLCIVGDIFDPESGKVLPWVENIILRQLAKVKNGVYVLAGNHDLPKHSWDNVNQSSFGVIWNSGRVRFLGDLGLAAHFGQPMEGEETGLVFTHQLVFPTAKDIPPSDKAITAAELLAMYPKAKWIFTGDMHRAFHYEKNGRHVVNPGCMLRQAVDFNDYEPLVYFVDTDSDWVEELPLLDTAEMITDTYSRKAKERLTRLDAFVEIIKTSGAVSLDFKANLIEGMKIVDMEVSEMVDSLLEECV